MSIANIVHGTGLTNPATKFIKFKNGEFCYWDKEKESDIKIELPIRLIVLEVLSTITGYHDGSNSGIFSNEVRRISDDELKVRSFKGGDIADGHYSHISDKIKAQGGRFTASIYALLNEELVNFHFVGAALSSWIETRNNSRNCLTYEINKLGDGEKGATKYKFPIFEPKEVTEEEKEKALELYNEILDPYLKQYLNKKESQEVNESNIIEDELPEIPEVKHESSIKPQDLPF